MWMPVFEFNTRPQRTGNVRIFWGKFERLFFDSFLVFNFYNSWTYLCTICENFSLFGWGTLIAVLFHQIFGYDKQKFPAHLSGFTLQLQRVAKTALLFRSCLHPSCLASWRQWLGQSKLKVQKWLLPCQDWVGSPSVEPLSNVVQLFAAFLLAPILLVESFCLRDSEVDAFFRESLISHTTWIPP